jgi:putative SOS response-associated peptidase YedK
VCGRVELDLEISNPAMRRLTELLKRQFPEERITSGEKFPTDLLPVFTAGEDKPALKLMRWGFPKSGVSGQVINARSETAALKPLFAESFRLRRCILPTSGFYEWSHDGRKTKYLFRFPDDPMVYLAALYNEYENEQRFVILTQEANTSMADIHNRMPVIISQNEIGGWLKDNDRAEKILKRIGPQLVKAAQ